MRRGVCAIATAVLLLASIPTVRATSVTYLLPFPAPTSVIVTEGNSEGDHEATTGEQYAFDFISAGWQASLLQFVTASRAGVVIGTSDPNGTRQCNALSCWMYASFVLLDQGDGTSALYEFVSPSVVVGDKVAQGQIVGWIAPSGLSLAPHLLFQVEATPPPAARSAGGWWKTQSVAVAFSDPGVLDQSPDGLPTRAGSPYQATVRLHASASAVPSLPSESSARLDQALNSWIAGESRIPVLYPADRPGDGYPLSVLIGPGDYDGEEAQHHLIFYQGVLLGYEVVSNHLILYMGQRDHNAAFYYVALNAGDVTNPWWLLPVAQGAAQPGGGQGKTYAPVDATGYLNGAVGRDFAFMLYYWYAFDSADPDLHRMTQEIVSQEPFTHEFGLFSLYSGWEGSFTQAPNYPSVEPVINHRLTPSSLDVARAAYIETLWTR